MAANDRGRALTAFAVFFGLLAISDLLKPLHLEGADTGLVFLGRRLAGPAMAIAGVLVGAYLAAYAAGIWRLRRWALPMAWGYVAWVTANVVLFPFRTEQPPDAGAGYWVFGIVYSVLAVGGAVTCAVLLQRRLGVLREPLAREERHQRA